MRILIFGASGAGSTTQGLDLSAVLGIPYFDTDYFFWEPSEPPFTVRRDPMERKQMLLTAISQTKDYIIGGSLTKWGDEWLSAFDIAFFLYLPPSLRMERLKKREYENYGDVLFKDMERNRLYHEFLTFASGYDQPFISGRSLIAHQNWMKKLNCPVHTISGDYSVITRRNMMLEALSGL